jgi:hypothetical protein
MPKTSVSANALRLPAICRRNLLVGFVTVIGSLASTQTSNANQIRCTGEPPPEFELIGLERAFKKAVLAREAAYHRYNKCEERFLANRPSPPKALAAIGRTLGRHLPDERLNTAAELKTMLKVAPDPTAKKTARAMLKIAKAYERGIQRLAITTGLTAAKAEYDATIQALYDLSRRIIDVPTSTIFGLAAKARVIKIWGLLDWWSDDVDLPEQLAAQVLDAIIVMAAGTHAESALNERIHAGYPDAHQQYPTLTRSEAAEGISCKAHRRTRLE